MSTPRNAWGTLEQVLRNSEESSEGSEESSVLTRRCCAVLLALLPCRPMVARTGTRAPQPPLHPTGRQTHAATSISILPWPTDEHLREVAQFGWEVAQFLAQFGWEVAGTARHCSSAVHS